MPGGLVVTSGGLAVSTGGLVVASGAPSEVCPCCGITPGTPCANCSGTTAATVDVAIVDVQLVTVCITGGGSGKITTGSVLSDVFEGLEQLPGFPCIYRKRQAYSSVVASFWLADNCPGAADAVSDSIEVSVAIVAGPIAIITATLYVGPGVPDATVGTAQLFSGSVSGDCVTGFVDAPNGLTDSAGAFFGEQQFDMGYDGTASAVPA